MNRKRSVLLVLILSLMLTLCSCTSFRKNVRFSSQGTTLSVPSMYVDLLTIDTTVSSGPRSTFFSVHETASLEAAKAMDPKNVGGGFLFGIGMAGYDEFMDMMCTNMTGADVFARDDAGNYYIYYHPTDVQLLRSGEYTNADWDQWFALSDWAATVQESFLADNPHLTPYSRTYTDLDLVLCRIMHTRQESTLSPYEGECRYASSAEQAIPFVTDLMDGVEFLLPPDDNSPDGEFIRLAFPDLIWSFDFFTQGPDTCYIRQTFGDGGHIYHMASKNGEPFPIGDVVAEWAASVQAVPPPLEKPPAIDID